MRFSLLLFLASYSMTLATAKAKCDYQSLMGKWHGSYVFDSGTSFEMVFEIDEVKNCSFSDLVRWPDYYNSVLKMEGAFKKNKLIIRETELLNGRTADLDGWYEVTFVSDTLLEGVGHSSSGQTANFSMRPFSQLSASDREDYERSLVENAEKFGTVKVNVGELDMTIDEILDRHREESGKFHLGPMRMEGIMFTRGVELPVVITLGDSNRMLMKMSIQNVEFMIGRNLEYTWQYDPFNRNIQRSSQLSESKDWAKFSSDLLEITEGEHEMVSGSMAKVDSLMAYRIVIKDQEGDTETFYVDTTSFQVIRHEEFNKLNYWLNYRTLGNDKLFPFYISQFSSSEHTILDLSNIELLSEVDPDIFYIPEELKDVRIIDTDINYVSQADEYYEKDDYSQALTVYTQAINQSPGNATYYFKRGKTRSALEDYYSAISDFNSAIEINSNYAAAYNDRGLAKYYLGDYNNAITDFDEAISLNDSLAGAHYNRGLAYYSLESYDSAVVSFDRAATLERNSQQFVTDLAVTQSLLGQYEKALKNYLHVEDLGGEGELLYNRIGVAYYNLDSFPLSENYFRKALSLDDSDVQTLENLGRVLYNLKEYEASVDYLLSARVRSEGQMDALYNSIAQSYYELEDFETSIAFLDSAISVNASNATYFDNRAYARSAIYDYTGAIEDFTRSIELYPSDPEVYIERGQLYKIQLNLLDACRDFRLAKEYGHASADELLSDCKFTKD